MTGLLTNVGLHLSLALFFVFALSAQQRSAAPVSTPRSFDIGGTAVHALTGEPVSAALITISPTNRDNQVQAVFTEANGRFLFQGIAPGKYRLRAKHKDFPQQDFEGHGPLFTAIVVGPDVIGTVKDMSNLVFRLKPEGSISGRVTDDEDDPVRGAKVMLFARNADTGERIVKLIAQTVADDQGAYHFGHLSAGMYFVAVSAHPWYARHAPQANGLHGNAAAQASNAELDVAYPVTYFPQETEPERANPITLNYGDHFTADVFLRAMPAVHLRLVSESPEMSFGSEAPALKQTLLGGVEIPIEAQVGDVGPNVQDLYGVAPGRYDLRYDTEIDTWPDPGHQTNAGPRRQLVDTTSHGEVAAAAGSEFATIAGSVKFEGGVLPREAVLKLRKAKSGQEFEAPVSSGEIQQIELTPGRYELRLVNSEGFVLKSVSAVHARALGETIEISSSGSVQLILTALKGNGSVEGLVRCNDKPAEGAMIVLVPQQDPENNLQLFRREQSGSDGTFTVSGVAPGRYTVLAIENGWELEWANPSALKSYLPGGQSIQIEPNSKSSVQLEISCKSRNAL